jgi:adenylosuccinate synthase
MVKVIVGTQFGDEGKGRAIELLAQKASVVARYQGGANAGHTIWVGDQSFVFHLIPSGAVYPHTACIMGNGMVIDPLQLIDEMKTLKSQGIELKNRLFISEHAHIVMPYHKLKDDLDAVIGTTHKGIGPCYEDKYARRGIRTIDLLHPEILKKRLKANIDSYSDLDFDQVYNQYIAFGHTLSPFITDTVLLLNRWIDEGKEILLEGSQGLLLDIDHGTYPFVTSSNPHSGGACSGLGISPTKIDEVIGVTKAYTSRVGEGPLTTTLPPELEAKVRDKGQEFGATTGRSRRCGWLDAVAVRRSLKINGVNRIILTKLDVLDQMPEIKICKEYKTDSSDPSTVTEFSPAPEPVYESLPGWETPLGDIRNYKDLPLNARNYIERVSKLVETEIMAIGVGPKKENTIKL